MTGRLWLYIELAARILYELRNMPGSTRVEYWCVGGTTVQYLPMTLGDVSVHLAADWVPSLPAVVGTSFVGWPPFLLESNFSGAHELLGLRAIARRSDRQWKSVLSWMLGVAGARHVLDSEGYRWIAPLSAFYPDAVQPVDLSNWHPIFPPSRVTATAAPGNPSRLRPDYIALRPTSSSSVALGWALVEAKVKHVVISGNQNRRIELRERRAAALRFVKIIRAETIGVRARRAVISWRSGGRRKHTDGIPRAGEHRRRIIQHDVVDEVGIIPAGASGDVRPMVRD